MNNYQHGHVTTGEGYCHECGHWRKLNSAYSWLCDPCVGQWRAAHETPHAATARDASARVAASLRHRDRVASVRTTNREISCFG